MITGVRQNIVSLPKVNDCVSTQSHTDLTLRQRHFKILRQAPISFTYSSWEIQKILELFSQQVSGS